MYQGNMPGVIQSVKRVRVEQNSFGEIQALCVWSLCFAFYQLWMHPKISTFSMCPGDGFCVQPRGEGRGPAVVRCRAWGCCQPGLLPVPIRMLCRESQSSPRQEEVCQGINLKQETVQPSMAQVLKASFLALWKMLSLWKLWRSKNFVWSINSRTLMKSKIYFFAW